MPYQTRTNLVKINDDYINISLSSLRFLATFIYARKSIDM